MNSQDFGKRDVADSMRAAASRLDVPLELVQQMKRSGCPAFKGSRVYLAELAQAIRNVNKPSSYYLFPIPINVDADPKIIEDFRELIRMAIRCRWLTTREILEIILEQVIQAVDAKLGINDFYNLTNAIHNGFGAAVMVLQRNPATDEFLKHSSTALTRAMRRVASSTGQTSKEIHMKARAKK